jgi:hypothetical protein
MEPTRANETSSSDDTTRTGPGYLPVGRGLIVVAVLVVIFAAIADVYALMKVWPHPTPSGAPIAANTGSATGDSAKSMSASAAKGKGDSAPTRRDSLTKGDTTTKADAGPRKSDPGVASKTLVRGLPGGLHCDTLIVPRTYALTATDSMYDPECVSVAGREFPLWAEQRLLFIVVLTGFLGGLVHVIRSLGWYIGNRSLIRSWLPFYALLPLNGAMLAVAFYLVIRGGFFSPSGSFRDTSPFGFAAMSVLVGMFSTPAALKLKELAETMFTKPGTGADAKPQTTSGTGSPKPPDVPPSPSNPPAPTPPAVPPALTPPAFPNAPVPPGDEQGGLPRANAGPQG